jgi:hypothetical protein
MKKLNSFFFTAWRPAVAVVSLAILAYVLYFHRLQSLLPGYSASELQTYGLASNWHSIVHDPINAPYKLIVWAAVGLGHHSLLTTRIVAAGFGVAAVLAFFIIAKSWHGFRVAFLSTILFATSAGFLHIARLGSGRVLQMSILVLIGCLLWYRQKPNRGAIATYGLIAVCSVLWYVPGLVWFELFSVIFLRRGMLQLFRDTTRLHRALMPLIGLLIVSPLLVAIFKTPRLALSAAGLPTTLHALTHAGSGLLSAIAAIGVRSNGNAVLWVGHAPLLNVVELALGAVGAYYYFYQQRSARAMFLGLSVIVSIILIGLGGVTYASLIPLRYLFIASGLSNLLSQWLTVFPRNPIARISGISLICIMLFFSVLYQTRSYFVAWPHDPATRQTFNHPQP